MVLLIAHVNLVRLLNRYYIMNLEPTINKQNQELLAELRKSFDVDFDKNDKDYCSMFSKNNKKIIYYNPKTLDDASIAHELLHIWLDEFDYEIGTHIFLSCKSHEKLNKIFCKNLCDYISNCFDHLKMYPEYLRMGYESEKFVINGSAEKCSLKQIKSLKLKSLWTYKASSIEKYIGYLVSIYADHIKNNYEIHLKLLEAKDPNLFQIVTSFWNSWTIFDIENIDPIFNSDISLVDDFIDDMKVWVEGHKMK